MPEIQLILADNLFGMKNLPDKSIDLAIIDPPYGIDGNSHRRNMSRNKFTKAKKYNNSLWDQSRPTPEFFDELFRVSKNQVIFGANYFTDLCPKIEIDWQVGATPRRNNSDLFLELNPTGLLLWDKVNGTNNFNDYEIAWTSFDRPSHIYKFMWNGMMQAINPLKGTEMNAIKSLNEKRIHPTQKPVGLYKYILHTYANPGDKILDTHLGSGSIAIACHEYDFDLIAFEKIYEYYTDCINRYSQHISQQSLNLF